MLLTTEAINKGIINYVVITK